MVHIPSKENWEELLATPHMARLTQAYGDSGLELTLILRCRTLEAKYILQSKALAIMLFKSKNGILCYGVVSEDAIDSPLVLWAACRDLAEYALLERLEEEKRIVIHLYNEACINVASADFRLLANPEFSNRIGNPKFENDINALSRNDVAEAINAAKHHTERRVMLLRQTEWNGITSHIIGGARRTFSVNILMDEEGGYQEQLAGWLTDSLHPEYIGLNLKYRKKELESEFADVTLSYEEGSFLIESKTLAILGRDNLPPRDDLISDTEKKITKASKQLRGGFKTLFSGKEVYDDEGTAVKITRDKLGHAICLIPDISLVREPEKYSAQFCRNFMKSGALFHLIDVPQLYRIVQASQMLSANSSKLPMECFDAYLVQRFDIVLEHNTVLFDMALDLSGATPRVKVTFGPE